MDASRFETLWTAFLSGETLTLAEENELAGLLEADPATPPGERERLLRDSEIDSTLRTLARCERTEWRFTAGVMDRIAEAEAPSAAAAVLAMPRLANESGNGFASPPVHLNGQSQDFESRLGLAPFRRKRWPWLVVAAAASIALSTALLYWLNREPDSPRLPGPGNDIAKNLLPDIEPLRNVAELTQAIDCVWEGLKPEGRLATGPVRLVKGRARITFDRGAIVELTGPAAFELLSSSQGFLHRGTLGAEVPPVAVGFKVQTPTALITDLGTAFDVAVDDSGITTVNVRKGSVEVIARNLEGDVGDIRRLVGGDAWRVEPVVRARPEAGFRDSLIIDGEAREFTDREEFEKAAKAEREKLLAKEKPPAPPPPVEPVPEPAKPEEPKKPVAVAPEKPEEKPAPKFEGMLEINGRRTRFNNPQQFDRTWKQMRDVFDQLALARVNFVRNGMNVAVGQGAFRGSIIINGERHEFDNQKDFEKLRRDLMKPFSP